MSSELAIGTRCLYADARSGEQVSATVIKVHYDDIPAYYTIRIDGREGERETIRSKLTVRDEAADISGGTANVAGLAGLLGDLTMLDGNIADGAARLFRDIDADNDGAITRRELAAYLRARGHTDEVSERAFIEMDKDGDGLIDYEEFKAASRAARAASASPAEREDARVKLLTLFVAAGGADALFDAVDGDKDGLITRRELAAHLVKSGGAASEAGRLLALVDGDKDGLVDRTEMRAAYSTVVGSHSEGAVGGEEAANDRASSSAPQLGAQQSDFLPGQIVRIDGLSTRPDLNGVLAEVEGHADNGRINVRVPAGHSYTLVALKPASLTRAEAAHRVTVPPGRRAGDVLQVQLGGAMYNVVVPAGIGPGMSFEFQTPRDAPSTAARQQQYQATVPAGMQAGQLLEVEVNGTRYRVPIPAGHGPGMSFTFQI